MKYIPLKKKKKYEIYIHIFLELKIIDILSLTAMRKLLDLVSYGKYLLSLLIWMNISSMDELWVCFGRMLKR